MSETPQFHPEIEKAFVTNGEDLGRIKDVEFAETVAHEVDQQRDFIDELKEKGESTEFLKSPNRLQHESIQQELIQRATTDFFNREVAEPMAHALLGHNSTDSSFVNTAHSDKVGIRGETLGRFLKTEADGVVQEYEVFGRAVERAKKHKHNK